MAKTVRYRLFLLLRVLFAVIGVLALAVVAFSIAWIRSFDDPVKWPKPDRDCLMAGARPVDDAHLFALAVAAWNEDAARYAEPNRQKYVGGPLILDEAKVYRLDTTNEPGQVVTANDYNEYYDVRFRYHLAERGLRRYAMVSLKLYAASPIESPASGSQAIAESSSTTTTKAYHYDLCGQPL